MSEYKVTIGLEVHAELNTETKMFCSCKNDPDEERPNVNVCPICMGHPGTLPAINKRAVESVLKVGKSIGGSLADLSEFDRKNYFYPDIPKGYQISQYKYPLVSGGELAGVAITRVHLEEDTATSSHDKGDYSLVNFNRAGVPLMELVTEPVIHSAIDAVKFGKELQLLLQYLGVAEANMEKGEMRLEANVSVSDTDKLGTKVEIKNLNSFKVAEKAIEYEIKRQSGLLEKGEKVVQETRGWNEVREETYSQRQKEDSHDYRYFPDPDLPKLKISELNLDLSIEETPKQKRERYKKDFKIKDSDLEVFVGNRALSNLFEGSARILLEKGGKDLQLLSNYIISDVGGEISSESLAEVIVMIEKGEISSRGAKDILAELMKGGGEARKIAEENGLFQKSDKVELKAIVEKVLALNPSVVEEYKGGKQASLQYLVGQSMKESKGSGNPGVLKEILLELLN